MVLFLTGCQRSGTSLMSRIFAKDLATRVYGEFSEISLAGRARLQAMNAVKQEIEASRASLIILKPLVETQNGLRLLDTFPGSKILWIYRNHKDVASSNLKKFGLRNGINDLRPIVEHRQDNWRAENVSDSIRETVRRFFAEQMNPYDAAALFWLARNTLFFDMQLDSNPRATMCRYDDFVTDSVKTMKRIYRFLGADFPGERIVAEVTAESVGKGREVILSPEVDRLCSSLLERLDHAYQHLTSIESAAI